MPCLRHVVLALAVAGGTALALPVEAQQPPGKAQDLRALMDEGQAYQLREDWRGALDAFRKAQQLAAVMRDTRAQGDAALRCAYVIEAWAASGVTPKPPSSAEEFYREAIALGTPQQQVLARNNLGVLCLREGKFNQALETFREIDPSSVPPQQRFLFRYNYGRALEARGTREGRKLAYTQYEEAIRQRPDYEAAVRKAFENLFETTPARVGDAADLATLLVAKGQPAAAAQWMRQALRRWGDTEQAQRLLAALIRSYSASNLKRTDFVEAEWPFLRGLPKRSEALDRAIVEVHRAYGDASLQPAWRGEDIVRNFPSWAKESWQAEPFSMLLVTVGESFASQQKFREALARYSAAWILDQKNTRAGLYTAAVLRDHAQELDREGALARAFAGTLFREDGKTYRVNYRVSADWQNVAGIHVLLGSIFARTPAVAPANELTSAVFQLNRALDAEKRIPEAQRLPSPGTHALLAAAYRRTKGQEDLAWDHSIQAAEGFLECANLDAASKALGDARSLGVRVAPEKQLRLATLEADLRHELARIHPSRDTSPDVLPLVGGRDFELVTRLLGQRPVQDELKLAEVQYTQVLDVAKRYRDLTSGLRDVSPAEQRYQELEKLGRDGSRRIADVLKPEQAKRLQQILLQQQGYRAFAKPEVERKLRFTDDQRHQVRTIEEDTRQELRILWAQVGGPSNEVPRKMAALNAESYQRVFRLLSKEQQDAWKELTGEPFRQLDFLTPPRRGRSERP